MQKHCTCHIYHYNYEEVDITCIPTYYLSTPYIHVHTPTHPAPSHTHTHHIYIYVCVCVCVCICCYCQTKPPGPSSQPKEMLQLHTKDTCHQPEETFCTDHHHQQHWRQNQRRHKQQPHKQHEPDQHHSSHMKSPALCTLPTASRTNTSAIDERRH